MSNKVTFTAAWVESIPFAGIEGRRLEYRDSVVPNLVLRVGSTTKTYYAFVPEKSRSGRRVEKKIKLGDFRLLTPQGARRLAKRHLGNEEPGRAMPSRLQIRLDDQLLTTREAATLTGMSMAWFERERWKGEGPPFCRAGRAVRYLKSDLLAWWATRRT